MSVTEHLDQARDQALKDFRAHFVSGIEPHVIAVPGRVNLIGEHIDYHNLAVLPMAIQRSIWIAYRPREDSVVQATSSFDGHAQKSSFADATKPNPSGNWGNYLKAAINCVTQRWQISQGIDAAITSDLPAASGLSSSSALLVAFALALLSVNGIEPAIGDLMEVLPEGEHFVGTRGGGMDHAAVLAPRSGSALLLGFAPLEMASVPIPPGWSFLIAHSLTFAEKSNTVLEKYNACRVAGAQALRKLVFSTYRSVMEQHPRGELIEIATSRAARQQLTAEELHAFLHVTGESLRVHDAVAALRNADAVAFGHLLLASHASLRSQLHVSSAALDSLVDAAMISGAVGARLTGAGFGGCVIALCVTATREKVRERLMERYYSRLSGFDAEKHLFFAEPSAGALHRQPFSSFSFNTTQVPL